MSLIQKSGDSSEEYFETDKVGEMFFGKKSLKRKQSKKDKAKERVIFDTILTDGYKAVSVIDGHEYIVID